MLKAGAVLTNAARASAVSTRSWELHPIIGTETMATTTAAAKRQGRGNPIQLLE
jgi:hypothetical protein